MKTFPNKPAKKELFKFSGFSKLSFNEMMKLRGGDATTGGDTMIKVPQ